MNIQHSKINHRLSNRFACLIAIRPIDQVTLFFLVLVITSAVTLLFFGLEGVLQRKDISKTGENKCVFLVDLNSSSQEELLLLPGIGEILAARIIEYRETTGLFESPRELKKIKGIGDKKIQSASGFCIATSNHLEKDTKK